jgi:hypothetical protein
MTVTRPSDLLRAWHDGVRPQRPVALDTETSGLHVDSGARVSTVSVGWEDDFTEEYMDGHYQWERWLGIVDEGGHPKPWQEIDGGSVETYGWERVSGSAKAGWEERPIISFAWAFDQGVAGTGKPEDDGQATLWADADNLPQSEWVALLEWLRLIQDSGIGMTMHHAKFDLHMTEAGVRRWPGLGFDFERAVDWDTQNGADLMTGWKFGTTSLKPTSTRLWGESEDNEQQVVKDYLKKAKLPAGRWDLIPWDVIGVYADKDARLTARLRIWQETVGRSQMAHLDGLDGRMTVDEALGRRLRTSKMLRRTERRGLPWSVVGAQEESAKIRAKIRALEKVLPFPATLPNAKHYWFGANGEKNKAGVIGMGLNPYDTTEKGAPMLNGLIVGKMVAEGVPHADTWRDIQKLETSLGRWYQGWTDRAGRDGRLRTSVRQNGTVSGRFSVENIQLQAIPNDYKLQGFEILDGVRSPRALIGEGVPKGWELWELDLAQAELRVAAMYAGCKRMLDLIDQGADLHGDAAEELFDVHPGDADWGKMRQVAKRANFSLIFGVGWVKLQADIEEQTGIRLSNRDTQRLVHDWNALYPEYQQAIRNTMGVIEGRQRKNKGIGWIQLPNGERRWFKPMEETHKGFNQRVQPNLAQYGIDWWLWTEQFLMESLGDDVVVGKYDNEIPGEYVGRVGTVLMVHDSVIVLVPEGAEGKRLVDAVQEYGKDLWAERFPGVPGDIDASPWLEHA